MPVENTEVVIAPNEWKKPYINKVFLAGTIENGTARDWQQIATDKLYSREGLTIYNPRRPAWGSEERGIHSAMFVEQVTWEQRNLHKSTHLLFNFEPESISLITMGEFFQFCNVGKKLVVCCPKEYRGYGNVSLMCALHSIPLYHDLDMAINHMNVLLNK